MLFNSNNAADTEETLKKRITSIKNELKMDVSYQELASAIKYGFQKNFGFDFFDDKLTNSEIKSAEKLRKEKYSTDLWNIHCKLKL